MKGKRVKGPLTEIASHLKQKTFDMEELVADNIGLEEIIEDDIKQFPNLQALFIPRNKLKVLNHLEKNFRITFLDARDNQIADINLPKQGFIRELYLSGNLLQDFETILAKMSHMKDLETLDLRGNPMTLEKGYRQSFIAQFPSLKILDGIEVVRPLKKKAESVSNQNYSRSISQSNQTTKEIQNPPKEPISKVSPPQTPLTDKVDTVKNNSTTPIKNARNLNTPAVSKSVSPKPELATKEDNSASTSSETEPDQKAEINNAQSIPTKTISSDMQSLTRTTELRQKKPRSVLQCLLTRPLSSADAIVKMKSDRIRFKQMQKQKRIEEEQTAVARKRKEEYERKSKCPPPLPDALLELEKKSSANNTEKSQTAKRASTRLFIKAPVIQELEEVPYDLEFAVKLNPKLPNIFNKRLTYATVYPKD